MDSGSMSATHEDRLRTSYRRSPALQLLPLLLAGAMLIVLAISPAYASHAIFGEGRSATFHADRFGIFVDLVPVTLRTSSQQVDMGGLLRTAKDNIYAGVGLFERTGSVGKANGFLVVCSNLIGCRGEMTQTGGRIMFYDVNQGISSKRFNDFNVFLNPLTQNTLSFNGTTPGSDQVIPIIPISSARSSEEDAHVGYYARNQEPDDDAAFTVQFPMRERVTGVGTNPLVSAVSFSVTEVEHPTGTTVNHFVITDANRGICAVFDGDCPDP